MIGQNIGTPWTTDVDLATSDGIHYSLMGYVHPGGEMKFRMNHDWPPSSQDWGGTTFPSGIGTSGPANLMATAGTYDISFNINTGAYNFATPLGISEPERKVIRIFPNPATNELTIDTDLVISEISVFSVTGTLLMRLQGVNTIPVAKLQSGLYMLHITSGNGTEVRKFLKK